MSQRSIFKCFMYMGFAICGLIPFQTAGATNHTATSTFQDWSQGAHSSPVPGQYSKTRIKRLILLEAQNYPELPVELALAVAKVESNFDASAVSSKGARGVMQIMPKTAQSVFDLDPDRLWDPVVNIRTGIHYLSELYQQYDQNWEAALSHYNGGSLKAENGYQPHSYTRSYIEKVNYWKQRYALKHSDPVYVKSSEPVFSHQAAVTAQSLTRPVSKKPVYSSQSELQIRMQSARARFRDSLQRWENPSDNQWD